MRIPFFSKRTDKRLVPDDVLSRLGSKARYTPDIGVLRMKKSHLLFAYDETMVGCRAHGMVHDPVYPPISCYTNRMFTMVKVKQGQMELPVILTTQAQEMPNFKRLEYAPIKGQLFKITIEQLTELDSWKDNGVTFRRERVFLDIPYREQHEERLLTVNKVSGTHTESTYHTLTEWKHHHTQDAWTYIGMPERFQWDQTITAVKLTVPSDNNLKPYFHFKDDNL